MGRRIVLHAAFSLALVVVGAAGGASAENLIDRFTNIEKDRSASVDPARVERVGSAYADAWDEALGGRKGETLDGVTACTGRERQGANAAVTALERAIGAFRAGLKKRDDARAVMETCQATAAAAAVSPAPGAAPPADPCKAKNDARAGADRGVLDALASMYDAEHALLVSENPAEFERLIGDESRRAACLKFREWWTGILADADPLRAEGANKARRDSAREAHANDLFRKAPVGATAVTQGTALIEGNGAPDTVIASIMTALGAERASDGQRLILTLNLARLGGQSEEDFVKSPASLRHLFLRADLPLSASDASTSAGTTTSTTPSTGEVARFNLTLGSSLLDDTDTRTPTNDECYRLVDMYAPLSGRDTAARAAEVLASRKALYDTCANAAAHKHRLAWRGYLGLSTDTGGTGNTDLEIAAFALLWSPLPWMRTNAFYRHQFEPDKTDAVGVGLSLGRNLGGRLKSGTDAWARMDLDVVALAARNSANERWGWQVRVAPAIAAKLFGPTTLRVSLGPRIVGRELGDGVDMLASAVLAYDADTLLDSIVTSGK